MKKELDSKQLDEIKEKLNLAESAVKRVPISSISVDESSLAAGRILVAGQPIAAGSAFFSKLGSLLKVNRSLTNEMIKKGDTKVAAALINGLKDYKNMSKKDSDVMLIANVNSKEIVDICDPGRYRRVTNDTLFDVTERILNDNPNLIVESVDHSASTGRAAINFLNGNEVGFAQAGKDEYFKFGFSIVQTTKDTMVETYNQRLICTNGLRASLGAGAISGSRGINFDDKFRLGGTDSEDIRIFLNKIEEMRKAGFVPPAFESAIIKAINTKASLFEIEGARGLAMRKLNEPDKDLLAQYQSALSHQYFHAYNDTMARIHRKGVDSVDLNPRQKQFIKTGMSIWDVVNSLTFLGSNNSGFPIDEQRDLKFQAGELFSKGVKEGYDLEFSQYASL